MTEVRTAETLLKESIECAEMVKKLEKSHGLREYWAEGVYYGEFTIEEAVAAQKENDKNFESLNESLEVLAKFVTSIKDFNEALKQISADF